MKAKNQTQTNQFILPMTNIDISEVDNNGFINSYIGNKDYDKDWGENIYVLYDSDRISLKHSQHIMAQEFFKERYYPEIGKVMFIMGIPTKYQAEVIEPFLRGEYSKINKEYVHKYFSKHDVVGNEMTNWKIFYKSPNMRIYWENILNVELDLDAEVWSRPLKREEIYSSK